MARLSRSGNNSGTVTTSLNTRTHEIFVRLAESRGMTLRSFADRWVKWFERLDESEQGIVLDQISRDDVAAVAELILKRKAAAEMRQVAENAGLRGIDSAGAFPTTAKERAASGGRR